MLNLDFTTNLKFHDLSSFKVSLEGEVFVYSESKIYVFYCLDILNNDI
jgi:hypothetical protein